MCERHVVIIRSPCCNKLADAKPIKLSKQHNPQTHSGPIVMCSAKVVQHNGSVTRQVEPFDPMK